MYWVYAATSLTKQTGTLCPPDKKEDSLRQLTQRRSVVYLALADNPATKPIQPELNTRPPPGNPTKGGPCLRPTASCCMRYAITSGSGPAL